MQTVNREELLNQLELLRPGLSVREVVEQSSCYIFKNGTVYTYNDEVLCSHPCSLSIVGAVQSAPLLSVLQRLKNEFVDVDAVDGFLLISAGKSQRAGIRMEVDILAPIEIVEKPVDWKKLPESFSDAIYIVSQCVGMDETQFVLTCVHITDSFVEACDNYQITRYNVGLKVESNCLIRAESIKAVVDCDMQKYSETQTWLHFENQNGFRLSCRKTIDNYPDLQSQLDVKGVATTLPKGLAEAAGNANVFTVDNVDNDSVLVQLSPKNGGMLRIEGDGAGGWYKEVKRLKYHGEPLKFRIAPKLLIELTKRYNQCEINQSRLIVDGGKFRYVTCLGTADE